MQSRGNHRGGRILIPPIILEVYKWCIAVDSKNHGMRRNAKNMRHFSDRSATSGL